VHKAIHPVIILGAVLRWWSFLRQIGADRASVESIATQKEGKYNIALSTSLNLFLYSWARAQAHGWAVRSVGLGQGGSVGRVCLACRSDVGTLLFQVLRILTASHAVPNLIVGVINNVIHHGASDTHAAQTSG
jgi:hypothetical protein